MADFETEETGDDKAMEISHSPLNLGGSDEPKPAVEQDERPVVTDTSKKISWPDRITGSKTFFAKLHAGAIEFLDEQVNNWLRDNPGVSIKMTNAVVGEIQAKKTEPNLIVTVWY